MPSFIVRVRSTVIEDYIVEAVDEDGARGNFMNGECTFSNEVERPDIEIESVKPNV